MAGTPGNPNHDPRSGRFTSASGLNRSNSTITQRGKAKVKENISAAGAFAVAAGAAVVGAAGAALLQGITRPIRARGHVLASHAIRAAEDKASQLVATHGPKIASAVAAKGSSLINHVRNMKVAGSAQHSVTTAPAKPRVRVPMGRSVTTTSPKPAAPKRAAAPKARSSAPRSPRKK